MSLIQRSHCSFRKVWSLHSAWTYAELVFYLSSVILLFKCLYVQINGQILNSDECHGFRPRGWIDNIVIYDTSFSSNKYLFQIHGIKGSLNVYAGYIVCRKQINAQTKKADWEDQ